MLRNMACVSMWKPNLKRASLVEPFAACGEDAAIRVYDHPHNGQAKAAARLGLHL